MNPSSSRHNGLWPERKGRQSRNNEPIHDREPIWRWKNLVMGWTVVAESKCCCPVCSATFVDFHCIWWSRTCNQTYGRCIIVDCCKHRGAAAHNPVQFRATSDDEDADTRLRPCPVDRQLASFQCAPTSKSKHR